MSASRPAAKTRAGMLAAFRAKGFIRHIETKNLLDRFFVGAVAAVLFIRFLLHVTGYPRLGAGRLHIAHMLLGGLFMFAALVILLTSLTKSARSNSAALGGIGFGLFVDELGKFITSDNDYFFEPTIAIIYVIFILIYLVFRALEPRQARLSDQACLINTLEVLKEAVVHDLDLRERREAEALLGRCDRSDPIVRIIGQALSNMNELAPEKTGLYAYLKMIGGRLYEWLVGRRWFAGAVVTVFIFSSLLSLGQAIYFMPGAAVLVLTGAAVAAATAGLVHTARRSWPLARAIIYSLLLVLAAGLFRWSLGTVSLPRLGIIEWGELFSTALAGILVLWGVVRIQQSRLAAYQMFERGVLVNILLTQFFVFYQDQLSAIFGLSVNIFILTILRHWIKEEEYLPAGIAARGEAIIT